MTGLVAQPVDDERAVADFFKNEFVLSTNMDVKESFIVNAEGSGSWFLPNHALDRTAVLQKLPSKSVLLLGSSMDTSSAHSFCEAPFGKLQWKDGADPRMPSLVCRMGGRRGLTVMSVFHPGAGEGPWFDKYSPSDASLEDTSTIVQKLAVDLAHGMLDGGEPTAIVVASALWDVSKWWALRGKPNPPYEVPREDIARWCHKEVPELLRLVSKSFPRSHVAFRTAPEAPLASLGQSPEILEAMNECIWEKFGEKGGLADQGYAILPYAEIVEKAGRQMAHAKKWGIEKLYKDGRHPRDEVSAHYMGSVLNWLEALP